MNEIGTPITVLKDNSIKLSSNPDEKIATMGSQNVKMINRIVKIINTIKKGIYSSNEKMEKVQIKELIEEVHCSVHIKTSSFHAT
jgi:Txe/YoeB family toxin of Txe-Axe toxin-antitoxin module